MAASHPNTGDRCREGSLIDVEKSRKTPLKLGKALQSIFRQVDTCSSDQHLLRDAGVGYLLPGWGPAIDVCRRRCFRPSCLQGHGEECYFVRLKLKRPNPIAAMPNLGIERSRTRTRPKPLVCSCLLSCISDIPFLLRHRHQYWPGHLS